VAADVDWLHDPARLLWGGASGRPRNAPALAVGGLAPGAAVAGIARLGRAWVVVPTAEDLERWCRALRWHGAVPMAYPADDVRPWSGERPDPEIPARRVAARDAWERGERVVVVCEARALLQRVPEVLPVVEVRVGQGIDRAVLVRALQARGWVVAPRVDAPGSVSVRGGTLDAWSPLAPGPVRIEWFDDEVERIRALAPDGPLDSVRLLPLREAVLDAPAVERALAVVRAEGRHMDPAVRRRLEADLLAGIAFPGVEDLLPLTTGVVALAPPGGGREGGGPPFAPGEIPREPWFCWEPDLVADVLARADTAQRTRWEALPASERPPVDPAARFAAPRELALGRAVSLGRLVMHGALDADTRDNAGLRVTGGELRPVARQLAAWAEEGRSVTLVVEGATKVEHLRALLAAHGVRPDTGRARPGRIALDAGDLPEGYTSFTEVVVAHADLFGERAGAAGPARGTRFREAAAGSLAALRPGDFVVHAKHGIGVFVGLSRMPMGETEGDFVIVRYRDGEKLYLPVTHTDALSPWRRVGEADAPRLDKLGGTSFEARRAKVRDAVLAMAHELLQIHARRALVEAVACRPGDMLRAFAASFPHVETSDQEAALEETLADMAEETPMDRLLVGDVGFGKTEVAMRAAACAVESGLQVAVLCPTTLLSHQHLRTFRERFAEFPVRVELLTGRGDAEVREAVASGVADIVIGTTSLLARGVRFKKLGLVVVDEEHRFGVRQKEQLKRIAAGAHYLALSATPIPRSLHMALAGIRGMSVLATPPRGRRPVRTEVVRFDAEHVREAIRAELERGGQVYFVHNRVQSLPGVAQWLRKQVPEARVGMVHGQMGEGELERAMLAFVRRETNVLACTTVVESGIDIPTANTMIVNRADTLGIAQLYQLRGRVGRSNVPARCVLLVSGVVGAAVSGERTEGAALRRAALERLRALQEHTELGSNFALASADLELRGGGELLGDRQHGHIAAIGFDAYVQLLEEAVARVRGQAADAPLDPEIEAPVPAWIPEDYVESTAERLDLYQQLASARDRDHVERTLGWMAERHGPLPEEVRNLGWMSGLRSVCRALGVARLAVLRVRVVVELAPAHRLDPARLLAMVTREPARFRPLGETGLEVRLAPDEVAEPLRALEYVLARLGEAAHVATKKNRDGA
jgi:transcription-repair coupling factor (superfamily II helicase)